MRQDLVQTAQSGPLATLRSELRSTLATPQETFLDPDYGYDYRELAWNAPAHVPTAVGEQAESWVDEHAEYFRPTTMEELGKCIDTLAACLPTAARAPNDASAGARVRGYRAALADLPGRYLPQALSRLLKTVKWLPTPAELREAVLSVGGEELQTLIRAREVALLPRGTPDAMARSTADLIASSIKKMPE